MENESDKGQLRTLTQLILDFSEVRCVALSFPHIVANVVCAP